MSRKVGVPIGLGTMSLLVTGLIYYALDIYWAVILSMIFGLICGLIASPYVIREIRGVAWLVVASVIILLMIFILDPLFFRSGPLYSLAASVAFSIFIGLAIAKPADYQQFGYVSLFFIGFLALFAQSIFNFLDLERYGALGHLIVFSSSGYLLQKRHHGFWKGLTFLSPLILVSVSEYILDPGPNRWFLHVAMPLIALGSFACGNLAAISSWPAKIPLILYAFSVSTGTLVFIPRLFHSNSWTEMASQDRFPEFHLITLEGDSISNQNLEAKVSWIEFYTVSCRPCLREMESSEKVASMYFGNDRVQFITVSSKYFESYEKFAKADAFHKFKLWHGYEQDTVLAGRYARTGVPVGLLVDKNGIVRYQKVGFGKNDAPYFEEELAAKINELLNE